MFNMNINFKFLLLGTSLSLITNLTQAQCVATIDCATLGYTETSCSNGKGLKCPFGNTFACFSGGCSESGFIHDCTGVNEKPLGNACNKKYYSCACASGYEWKNGKCEAFALGTCTGKAKDCKIGQILNADGSCTDYRVGGVEPVGIVAYIGSDGCGQALALESLGYLAWSIENIDIPNLTNYSSAPTNDFNSCKNTQTVLNYSYKEYGDSASKYYPLFWKAHDYAPVSIPSTKGKWCIPAGGILNNIYKNKEIIDKSLTRINEEKIGGSWFSSSEYNYAYAWECKSPNGDFVYEPKGTISGYNTGLVRPVIEF